MSKLEACPLCNGTKKVCVADVEARTAMEIDCPECTPEYDPDEDERFEAADRAYDLQVEDSL